MAGKQGMVQRVSRTNVGRQRVWAAMRIMRSFTIPDLIKTSGEYRSNIAKFIKRLTEHGYVRVRPGYVKGRAGVYQTYDLARNPGPDHPVCCDRCGQALGKPCYVGAKNISPNIEKMEAKP